jgi:quercetin dioxygenase-like cupin family protein
MRHRSVPAAAFIVLAPFIAFGAGIAAATQVVNPFWTTPVVKTDRTAAGQPIAVPVQPTVIVSHTTIAVRGKLPVHKHPHQRYVYVIEGTLAVSRIICPADDPKIRASTARPCYEFGARTYKAGDFIAEMRDIWHTGRNVGEEWVKLVVIDQVPAGAPSNMVLRE